MLYWKKGRQPMIIARIHFKPEYASSFIFGSSGTQTVIEQSFESPEALVEVLKEFEPYITDCTTVINGKMLTLSAFTTQ